MSEKIRLTKKQILFLTEWLETEDPNKAADRFIELMMLEHVDPQNISVVIDKIMKKTKN